MQYKYSTSLKCGIPPRRVSALITLFDGDNKKKFKIKFLINDTYRTCSLPKVWPLCRIPLDGQKSSKSRNVTHAAKHMSHPARMNGTCIMRNQKDFYGLFLDCAVFLYSWSRITHVAMIFPLEKKRYIIKVKKQNDFWMTIKFM